MGDVRPTDRKAGGRALADRAGFLLSQLGLHGAQRFAERLQPLGLGSKQFGLLIHVAALEGQSQQALSEALGIHRSATVGLIDDLERRGLAERRRDPSDRRAYALYLTPAARDLLGEAERIADEHDAELLATLNELEGRQLISLLQRVANAEGLPMGVHPYWGRSSGRSRRHRSPE